MTGKIKSGIAFSLLLALGLEAGTAADNAWEKRKEALKQDESVVRYYTFEEVENSKSAVKDLKGSGADLTFKAYRDRKTKEMMDDLEIIEGRQPGKPAVRLNRGWYQGAAANVENRQFTATVWFRRNGPGFHKHSFTGSKERKDGAILANGNGYSKGWRLVTVYDQRQSLEFFLGGSEPLAEARARSLLSVPDGVWHHLAATWNGEEMKLYLNGIPAGSKKYSGRYVPSGENDFLKIGYIMAGVGSVILDVDEVVIYNRVLSEREISEAGREQTAGIEEILDLADRYLKKGDYERARAEYGKVKKVSGIDYGIPMALFNIAESYRLEKDYANTHKTYREIFGLPELSTYYRIYGLFRQAEACLEQEDYGQARQVYEKVMKTGGALEQHVFTARLKTADTYRAEKKYAVARNLYEKLLTEEEACAQPHEVHRLDLRDRLEEINGLADGTAIKSMQEKRAGWVNLPEKALYVSPQGSDANPGTKAAPFATIRRAQEEARKIKEKGLPAGGMAVYLRNGNYFLAESLSFETVDSGSETAPVVYRSYPGEKVRIIGGRQLKAFSPVRDKKILEQLSAEARGKVWEADLKEAGINDYGELLNRGGHNPPTVARQGAMEVIFNGKALQLARWPNKGYERIAGLPDPAGDGSFRNKAFQRNRFVYPGNRPARWKEEKEVWIKGYLAETMPFQMIHVKMVSLDTEKKIIETAPDARWGERYSLYNTPYQKGGPFYAYNLLSEIDSPGEWYIDRDTGKLYIWPPEDIEKSEVIVTTLEKPVITFNKASHMVLSGLTIEGTWTHAVDIQGGRNILVAGNTMRNTGQYAVNVKGGWNHSVFGCDIYDTGEGGVILDGGDHVKLIPSGHTIENNHIHRFNRFCGGYRPAALLLGTGHRVSRNLIHDAPMHAIYLHGSSGRYKSSTNDHVIEFNEFHDVPYEAREFGAIYIYSDAWQWTNRGNIIRNNFFHHISYHSSPNMSQGLNAIHIDSHNSGFAVTDNFFYLVPNGISNPQPENRLENNIFIDPENRAISQGNRWHLLHNEDETPIMNRILRFENQLKTVNYKQPTWSHRYPQLVNSLSGNTPFGWAKDNVIERNVNTGGPFISIARGIRKDNIIRNNWEEGDPLFVNRKEMDFCLRTGSPVFGNTGYMPVSMEKIGVYRDKLRASWPPDRTKEDIGKYYITEWKAIDQIASRIIPQKRVSKTLNYRIMRTGSPVKIDGTLNREEWLGLDRNKAMVIEQYYTGEKKKGPKSYVWMLYDDKYLYVASMHEPDPYVEGMPPRMKDHLPVLEMSIETHHGIHSRDWWVDDMPTGPIYIFWGNAGGKVEFKNNFGMPHARAQEIGKSLEYASTMLDKENLSWVSELKIPFASIGLKPEDAQQLAFNAGVYKRGGWFTWVATGTNVWRIENAGFIRFE